MFPGEMTPALKGELMSLLAEQEIAFFRVNGYVIKRAAVESDLVARCRDAVWANTPEDRGDRSTWPDGAHAVYRSGADDDNFSPWAAEGAFVELRDHESLLGVARQLLGADQTEIPVPGYVMLRFPSNGEIWSPPGGGHIDSNDGNSFGAATLIDEVRPRGGGYTVWPGTHLMFHHYFRTHDVRKPLPGGYGAVPWPLGGGIEFTGSPGDVCYVHPWLVHTVGHNVNDNVRMQIIGGYHRKSGRADYDSVPDDPWWYWDGMKDVERRMRAEGRNWTLDGQGA